MSVFVNDVVHIFIRKREYPVLGKCVGEVGAPGEIFRAYVFGMQFHLESVEPCASDIGLDTAVWAGVRKRYAEQHVGSHLVIVVEDETYPVLQKREIHSRIQLCGGFPFHGCVLHFGWNHCRQAAIAGCLKCAIGVVKADSVVACLSV